MKKHYILILFLNSFIFITCSNYWTFVNSSYKNMKPREPSLLIILIDSIQLDYQGSVREEFGVGDSIKKITNYLLKNIKIGLGINSVFNTIETKICKNCKGLVEVFLPYYGKDSIKMRLPDLSKSAQYESDEIFYILFLEEFLISSKVGAISAPSIGVFIPQKPLIYDSKFALWDNKNGNLVTWGRVMVGDTSLVAVTMEEWNSVTYKFSEKLFKETPFGTGNTRYRLKEINIFSGAENTKPQ